MEEKRVRYKNILAEPEYRKLIFSNAVNRFGDSIDSIAFTWLVYQITHNAMWSAVVFGLNMLPNVIVQPFAGAAVEKMNKKTVIVLTHLVRAMVIAAYALMYQFELVNAPVMAAATLVVTTIESFNLPASSAYTAAVMKREH
ncbi:MAG: MFS transporter, partial [Oscillospiraceae bacterium]|nr:MFS transporter [Oscillospiraceae bacterium]